MSEEQVQPKVRFVCNKYPNLKIVWKPEQSGYTIDSNDGRQVVVKIPGKDLEFKNAILETADPEVISFIRNHPHFTGEDKKVIVEALPPDPYQQAIAASIRDYGAPAVAQLLTGAIQQAKQTPQQNPVQQTVQYHQQQAQGQNVVPMQSR